MATSIHRVDRSGCPAQSAGNPDIAAHGTLDRPERSAAVDRLQLPPAGVSTRRTQIVEPNNPANMLPFTNAPRLPNIGLITTAGSAGIIDRNPALSCSVGFGICIQP